MKERKAYVVKYKDTMETSTYYLDTYSFEISKNELWIKFIKNVNREIISIIPMDSIYDIRVINYLIIEEDEKEMLL